MIRLFEHPSDHYSPRTFQNVHRSNGTIALAVDLQTFGEICTRNAASRMKKPYLGIDFNKAPSEIGREVLQFCRKHQIKILNIAGNGLYTFRTHDPKGYSQELINYHVTDILSMVKESHEIDKVLTGGQTGVDWAAIIACKVLEINCDATFPKGYKRRNAFGIDFLSTREQINKETWEAFKVLTQ